MRQSRWWQSAVFYQIYPRSFCDSNGDGIGDIGGIISKLDYLQDLGINAIWLSPHYPSPMKDCGYDVSDYQGVAPEYGTMSDFRQLLDDVHQRDMYLVTDLVLNHTSDEHDWFKQSRSEGLNPRRDWYIWKPPKNGNPPNNWVSTFGGSAWEYDSATQEYYYHFFFKEQPDLNWWNPEVKAAMFDMVRFWLNLGVDGFRLDAVGTIFEDERYLDQKAGLTLEEYYVINRKASSQKERKAAWKLHEELFFYQHDQPGVHGLMKELRKVVNEYDQRVLIGETDDVAFYGSGDDELNLVFNFPLMQCEQLNTKNIKKNQVQRRKIMPAGAWACNTLGNHDSPRMMNRFGNGYDDEKIAQINFLSLIALQGTPVLYNGEEIGMTDYLHIPINQYKDPLGVRAYQLEKLLIRSTDDEAMTIACKEGRDKCRTPMQWNASPNAGFCPENVSPWLPVNPNYSNGFCVADQIHTQQSLLNFYKHVLNIRKLHRSMQEGEMTFIDLENSALLCVSRVFAEETIIIGINFSDQNIRIQISWAGHMKTVFLSDCKIVSGEKIGTVYFGPYGLFISEKLRPLEFPRNLVRT